MSLTEAFENLNKGLKDFSKLEVRTFTGDIPALIKGATGDLDVGKIVDAGVKDGTINLRLYTRLDADAYPGRYENDDWGTLTLTRRGGELTARIGDLALVLVAAARDSFTGHTEAGDGYEGRFVVDEGRVIAVICEDEDVTIRFERRGDPG